MARYRIKIVDIDKQQFYEKMATRLEGYLTQLSEQFKELKEKNNKIDELIYEINEIKEVLEIKEESRKKTASKVGGLQKSLNKEKTKVSMLLNHKLDLENVIEKKDEELDIKELELKTKNAEIKMLRGRGKTRNVEDYKNYVECRHELERRKNGE